MEGWSREGRRDEMRKQRVAAYARTEESRPLWARLCQVLERNVHFAASSVEPLCRHSLSASGTYQFAQAEREERHRVAVLNLGDACILQDGFGRSEHL
jgi:hypothetical protein